MPRKPRIWYPGAMYHITCRGNHRREIFLDDQDRIVYLRQLLQAKEDHECSILAYCLMGNHVHLQVETSEVEIWKMMKQLNMRYVIYFNAKYDLVCRLFQDRYRAELIEDSAYSIRASRYIHLNPVVAQMVKHPLDYPWSSYREYAGVRRDNVVSPGKILIHFAGNVREYQQYVEGALESSLALPD